jgi:beta-N-acetylhexosaminidase
MIAVLVAACSGSSHPHAASTTTTGSTSTSSSLTPTSSTPGASTSTTRPRGTTTSTVGCVALGTWSVPRLAAQVIAVPALNFDVAELGGALQQGVGGVLFLGNAPAPADLADRIRAADAQTDGAGPLLAMADEEGGGITRMAPLTPPVPWPRTMAATMSTSQVRSLAATVGRQMRAAGVQLDLAPVVDLDDRPGPSASNPDGQRSFSGSAAVASAYARAFAQGLAQGGEGATLKHFPGLGHSTGNTDVGPATTLPFSTLQQAAIPAFRSTLPSATAVMVANAAVPGLTSGPATLSSAAITGLLRNQLGWHGLVLTDSLSAGAIRATGLSLPSAAARSIAAGADMVLFGSTLTPSDTARLSPAGVSADTSSIVAGITTAVAQGTLSRARLQEAAAHVLAAKHVAICS